MSNDDSKIIEPYVKAYEAGYKASEAKSHTAKKKAARLHAAKVSPTGGRAVVAFGECAAKRRSPGSGLEWLGQRIAGKLSRLNLNTEQSNKDTSALALYRSLVDKFDCVPCDIVLEHLNGHSRANFSTARGTLKKRYGYMFSSLGDAGWRVDVRPTPPTEIEPVVIEPTPLAPTAIQQQLPTPPDVDVIAAIVAEVMKQFAR